MYKSVADCFRHAFITIFDGDIKKTSEVDDYNGVYNDFLQTGDDIKFAIKGYASDAKKKQRNK